MNTLTKFKSEAEIAQGKVSLIYKEVKDVTKEKRRKGDRIHDNELVRK